MHSKGWNNSHTSTMAQIRNSPHKAWKVFKLKATSIVGRTFESGIKNTSHIGEHAKSTPESGTTTCEQLKYNDDFLGGGGARSPIRLPSSQP